MKINDISFKFEIEHEMISQEKDVLPDKELLDHLSRWVKFNKSEPDWQSIILSRFGSFPSVLTAASDELQKGLSLSEKDSANIKLCYEISLRILKTKIFNCDILRNKHNLTNYLIAFLSRKQTEYFLVYFLDEKNVVFHESIQGNGTVNTTSVYIREITRSAMKSNASSIILVHNHPTGVAFPSKSDEMLTEMVTNALKVINIRILDHLIIGNGCYFSFEENNLVIPPYIDHPK